MDSREHSLKPPTSPAAADHHHDHDHDHQRDSLTTSELAVDDIDAEHRHLSKIVCSYRQYISFAVLWLQRRIESWATYAPLLRCH